MSVMTDMQRVAAYHSAMAQARMMRQLGIIDSPDIVSIEHKLAEKYGLNIGSIYREIDLINLEFRANMLSEEVELCQNP